MNGHISGHPPCEKAGHHVCHQRRSRRCIEDGCMNTAGTIWGPLWCPDHDSIRLANVSAQMTALLPERAR